MILAVFSALILLGQSASSAAPGAVPSAVPANSVSGVTITPKAQETQAQREQQADTVVCHNEEVLGSKFPKKVCSTRRQEADRKQADKEVARDFQRSVIGGGQPH